jgi:hypothetical protein
VTDEEGKKPTLTELELSFVTIMHQHWMLHGELMSAASCRKDFGLDERKFTELMATPLVKQALEERGIVLQKFNLDGDSPGWSNSLTPQQLIVANTMLDLTDTRSNKKKLQDLKISTAKYNAWLQDPVFSTYLRERAESMMGSNQHEVLLALMDKANSGDTKAISYYLEFIGRFTPAANKQAANQQFDVQSLLISIIEIISDEVDDPNTAARIADRLKSLGQARTIAGEILGNDEPIVKPQVAQARVLSPAMQELMESGAGVNG